MQERSTTVDTTRPASLNDMQRIIRALEAIASGLSKQLSLSSTGVPQANTRVVPVDNSRAVRLAPASSARTQLTFQNQDAANDITLGHDQGIRYGQGIKLSAGMVLSDDGPSVFRGEWWAIANVAGPVTIGVDDQG